MELRHLRYFIAVAEELHFTRAAERLGINQPPLSMQIRQLEQELGTPLFRRLTRGVELTDSGALLLQEARRIIDQVQRTKELVQSRARGETGHIRVGFASATYFQPLVLRTIRAYRDRFPGVTLSAEQNVTPRLAVGLSRGEIDVAFVRPPLTEGEGLALELLADEPMIIVLPASHPLAAERTAPLAALAGEKFIFTPRAADPGLYDGLIASCQRAGFSPILGEEAPQIPSIVHMVAAGFGVSVVPQGIQQIHAEGAVYLRIQGTAPRAPIGLASRKDDSSARVRNFVALARRKRSVA
jgi:DNA-binding transcriptional LysR family regulator